MMSWKYKSTAGNVSFVKMYEYVDSSRCVKKKKDMLSPLNISLDFNALKNV